MLDILQIALGLAGINLLTFFFFWHDKRCARKGHWRVPESMLLSLCMAGGSPTAYVAMNILRHKTRKGSFRARYWMIVATQTTALIYWTTHGMPTM